MSDLLPSRNSKVTAEFTELASNFIEKITEVWNDCGYDDEFVDQRCKAAINHCKDLFEAMINEEQDNKTIIINKIEHYLKEASELRKELNQEIIVTGYEELPLCKVEKALKTKLEKFRKIKESRLETLDTLLKKEKLVCDALGIQPRPCLKNKIPTEEQLQELETYINEKNEEKAHLIQIFQQSKSAIIGIMTELQIIPTLEFEKLIVCEEDCAFKVTKANMSALKELHRRLDQQLSDAKAEADELREKLSLLWERLHEEYRRRDHFLGLNRGYSLNTIKVLKEELKRCEELKRQNIKIFVGEIRKELDYWWNKCLIDEEERRQYLPYSSECYTEDLLELHEFEVEKYKNYYEDNRNIFELINNRQKLWDKMLELQERANDPNRLFQNRGGQLLLEEKQRKNIQKDLPKVEKELLKYVAEYEEKNNTPFLLHGENIVEIINSQWQAHRQSKDLQKKAKKVERDRLLEVESKLGTQSCSKGTKRKVQPITPGHSTTKLAKIDVKSVTERKKPTLPVSRNIFAESGPNASVASNQTTYTEFQDHLEVLNRDEICRSSVAPDRCLRERNTPAKTPSRIPTKLIQMSSTKKTPQIRVTPMKPPRKNLGSGQGMPKTPLSAKSLHKANSPYQKGARTTPRLTAARGRLPIII